MATIKVSNEEVISYAKLRIREIQRERHKREWNFAEEAERAFAEKKTWFRKPAGLSPWQKGKWLSIKDMSPIEGYFYLNMLRGLLIYSSNYDEDTHWKCLGLICMAKVNEEDYMLLTMDEATVLGIC